MWNNDIEERITIEKKSMRPKAGSLKRWTKSELSWEREDMFANINNKKDIMIDPSDTDIENRRDTINNSMPINSTTLMKRINSLKDTNY